MFSISFASHLIRHSGTVRAFKDTQTALQHLRHSERTRALGHSEGTQENTRRALGWALWHSRHFGTRTLKALKHLGTWALKTLRYLGTQTLGHLGHLGIWEHGHSRHSGTRALGHSRHFI